MVHPYLKEGKFAFTITYPAGFFARDAMDTIKAVSDGETNRARPVAGHGARHAENADTAARLKPQFPFGYDRHSDAAAAGWTTPGCCKGTMQ